jgi:hypothetical protein
MLVLYVVITFLPRKPQDILPQIFPVSALKALSVGKDMLCSTPAKRSQVYRKIFIFLSFFKKIPSKSGEVDPTSLCPGRLS